jgi:hypothetical protein
MPIRAAKTGRPNALNSREIEVAGKQNMTTPPY